MRWGLNPGENPAPAASLGQQGALGHILYSEGKRYGKTNPGTDLATGDRLSFSIELVTEAKPVSLLGHQEIGGERQECLRGPIPQVSCLPSGKKEGLFQHSQYCPNPHLSP